MAGSHIRSEHMDRSAGMSVLGPRWWWQIVSVSEASPRSIMHAHVKVDGSIETHGERDLAGTPYAAQFSSVMARSSPRQLPQLLADQYWGSSALLASPAWRMHACDSIERGSASLLCRVIFFGQQIINPDILPSTNCLMRCHGAGRHGDPA